ncbi:fibronectin type III domain-containing protein [Patescibacteria group bacterium]|nr:fibronectin type III domain-containing protein [Patescibacteria group bacterium]
MKKLKKIKTIPTLIGLLIVTVGLITSVFLVNQSQNLILKASGDITPSQIRITNQTASSAAISWFTTEATTGSINFGTKANQLDQSIGDQRSLTTKDQASYFSHYVILENLQPDVSYFFEIYSNGKKFDDSGKPFEIITAPAAELTSLNKIMYGQIFQAEGLPAQGAIVYLNLPESNTLSALVDSSGSWAVSLHSIRTKNLVSSLDYADQVAEIFVQAPLGTANAVINTTQENPVPNISLGESYDFRQATPSETILSEELTSGFNIDSFEATPTYQLLIMNPQDEEPINTQNPLFFGKAPANQEIIIEIHSDQIIADRVSTNEWGDWSWSPPEGLEPGEHTITVSFYNDSNILETISRSFVVLAAESSDLPSFTATPSATPTTVVIPTVTPTVSPTTTPSPTPTIPTSPTPTTVVMPTVTPTVSPTTTPSPPLSPTPTSTQEATSAIQPPGTIAPTYFILILGAILIGSGLAISIL